VDSPPGTGTAGSRPPAARVVAGRYSLRERLGSGGMGTVWRAVDEVLGREVAVKELVFPHGLSDADRDVLRERTRREARLAARLDHPSAVTVFDVVEEHGTPFLVMELVEARTLSDVVRSDGPLTPQRAGEVGLCVLGALEAAHRHGIVHRDVKPGNVLLGTDGRVVLTDFGIATSSGDASITSTGMLLGSPSYIAPERARGQQPGPASDLWSLGATLFTAVEGRPPYDAGDPLATVTAVVTGEHAPFAAAGPLEPVITGLLERDPAQRFDAETARVMLEQVARGADLGPAPRPARPAVQQRDRTAALPMDAVHAQAAGASVETPVRPARPVRPTAGALRRAERPAPRPVGAVLVVALIFLVATVAGGWFLLRPDDDDGSGGSPSASPSPSAPAEGGRPEGVPADWAQFTHPSQGWQLYHPENYAVTERRGLTQFRDDDTRYTLRVDGAVEGGALAAEQAIARSFSAALGGYQQLRLEPVEAEGADEAAELEFTYSDSGADLRAVHRAITLDGQTYTFWWQTNADRFAESLEQFEALTSAFVPAS